MLLRARAHLPRTREAMVMEVVERAAILHWDGQAIWLGRKVKVLPKTSSAAHRFALRRSVLGACGGNGCLMPGSYLSHEAGDPAPDSLELCVESSELVLVQIAEVH